MSTNRYLDRPLWSTSTAFCLAFAVALATFSGCGYSPPYSCVKVSGKVTYEDGSLIPSPGIRLVFIPQVAPIDARTPPHKGNAEVNVKTGEFDSAWTFEPKDGIIAGESKVEVLCTSGASLLKLVPPEYSDPDKTPLRVNTSNPHFVLTVPKPH
jgi:hypothetical protein